MSRFITFTAAGAIVACVAATGWSQSAQSGGGGTVGASGNAGAAGSAGAAGAAGQAGANAGAAAQPGTGQLQTGSNVPGQQQFGSAPFPNNQFNFNGPNRNPFFADPRVRQQLNMNDNQFNRLNQSYEDAWMRYHQDVGRLGSNLTPQQRMQQMQQLEARFNQQFGQSLDTTFTDPQVRTRFNQLNWQFQPFAALSDRSVSQQLQLTPQQQRQLRLLGAQWRQQMQRLQRAGNDNNVANPQLADEQFTQLQLQFQQQFERVLTPEQQQAWNQLIGPRFNFPRTAFIPRGTVVPRPGSGTVTPRNGGGTPDRGTPPGTPGVSLQGTQGQNTER